LLTTHINCPLSGVPSLLASQSIVQPMAEPPPLFYHVIDEFKLLGATAKSLQAYARHRDHRV
jgi:hypothetical protein